jgi:hypothetical protein
MSSRDTTCCISFVRLIAHTVLHGPVPNATFADCHHCQRTMTVVRDGLRTAGTIRRVYRCTRHTGAKHSLLRGTIFHHCRLGMPRMIEVITAFAHEGGISAVNGQIYIFHALPMRGGARLLPLTRPQHTLCRRSWGGFTNRCLESILSRFLTCRATI